MPDRPLRALVEAYTPNVTGGPNFTPAVAGRARNELLRHLAIRYGVLAPFSREIARLEDEHQARTAAALTRLNNKQEGQPDLGNALSASTERCIACMTLDDGADATCSQCDGTFRITKAQADDYHANAVACEACGAEDYGRAPCNCEHIGGTDA